MAEGKLGNSPFCRNVVTLSVLNVGFSMGYALTSLNPLGPVFMDLYNETYKARYDENLPEPVWTTLLALTSSLLLAGGFCGAITVTNVLQFFTPKQAMIFWSAIDIVGTVIIAAIGGSTGSYEAVIFGRFLTGYGLGLGLNIGPIIVAEYSIQKLRGRYQSMMGMAIPTGELLSVIIAHPKVLGTTNLWTIVVSLSCVFAVVYICVSPWIPESPRTLLRQGKRDEAIKVLKRMRVGYEDAFVDEISAIETELKIDETGSGNKKNSSDNSAFVGIVDICRNVQYRRQLILVMMVYMGSMTVGINHALLFSDRIFLSAGIPEEMVTNATIGVFALQTAAAVIGMRFLASYSSRKVLLVSLVITAASHIITTASIATQDLSATAGYIAIVGILLLLTSVSGGPNLVIWALGGDLTIERTRPTILKYAGGGFWVIGWATGFSAPYLDEAIGAYAFIVWLVFTLIYFVLVFIFIPETRGKTSEEIQSIIMGRKLEATNEILEETETIS